MLFLRHFPTTGHLYPNGVRHEGSCARRVERNVQNDDILSEASRKYTLSDQEGTRPSSYNKMRTRILSTDRYLLVIAFGQDTAAYDFAT